MTRYSTAFLRSNTCSANRMATKSIFREFIAILRRRWKKDAPYIRPLSESRGRLPKASTFYAGAIKRSGQHIYLYFQHSSMAWEVGQFTINVVLSADEYSPLMDTGNRCGSSLSDGYYRIGGLIGTKDKWWHLKQDDDPIVTLAWRPSSYGDREVVLSEAVEDVTRDVLSVLSMLGRQAVGDDVTRPKRA
jgi:hypothetical protein